jgi:hypothetical protein
MKGKWLIVRYMESIRKQLERERGRERGGERERERERERIVKYCERDSIG